MLTRVSVLSIVFITRHHFKLSDEHTARVLSALLSAPVRPEEVQFILSRRLAPNAIKHVAHYMHTTVGLTAERIADVFGTSKHNIYYHLRTYTPTFRVNQRQSNLFHHYLDHFQSTELQKAWADLPYSEDL